MCVQQQVEDVQQIITLYLLPLRTAINQFFSLFALDFSKNKILVTHLLPNCLQWSQIVMYSPVGSYEMTLTAFGLTIILQDPTGLYVSFQSTLEKLDPRRLFLYSFISVLYLYQLLYSFYVTMNIRIKSVLFKYWHHILLVQKLQFCLPEFF